ncbi:hypothetical protein BJF79_13825 [Actinomadura sp. CNU-125]|uniref:DUF3168 domain-containing protein n=1 Tax=Actinomadura sp. CNU-125 TaxID=1904961 RepID=UPI00095A4BDD|nr:DUF3168 domain-containing protein [Actinomadura sp. CNU-125]OLT24416.1 hypothetical protein BJF79_13825 [Actinomadura sp. CNU-125]
MTTVAAAAPHTTAVKAALESIGLAVGRGIQPPASGWQGQEGHSPHIPYVVLYPGGGTVDGTVAEPVEYLDYTCQLTCVGASQDAAETVADLAKAALVNQTLTVPDRASYRGQLLLDRPAERDDTAAPPVHYVVLQLGWRTQPE